MTTITSAFAHSLASIATAEKNELVRVQKKYKTSAELVHDKYTTQKNRLQGNITYYKSMDVDERNNAFMSQCLPSCEQSRDGLSEDDRHIDFWNFYEYMKTRTNDIENIKSIDNEWK